MLCRARQSVQPTTRKLVWGIRRANSHGIVSCGHHAAQKLCSCCGAGGAGRSRPPCCRARRSARGRARREAPACEVALPLLLMAEQLKAEDLAAEMAEEECEARGRGGNGNVEGDDENNGEAQHGTEGRLAGAEKINLETNPLGMCPYFRQDVPEPDK